MKPLSTKSLSFIVILAILFLSACSKKNTPAPNTETGTVVINGINYPTITIGSQTWTSTNYYGSGGSLPAYNVLYGNYYTLAQASAITLPAGWHIPSRADYDTLLSNFTTIKNSA
ncbi:MAG TPA: hypothetical protein VGC01_01170, partial [Mucilaginibacter sp.]